jgi:hypothetical protein
MTDFADRAADEITAHLERLGFVADISVSFAPRYQREAIAAIIRRYAVEKPRCQCGKPALFKSVAGDAIRYLCGDHQAEEIPFI